MKPEIKLVTDRVVITMPNGDEFKISCSDTAIYVNLYSDNGDLLVKPKASNEVAITSIDVGRKL